MAVHAVLVLGAVVNPVIPIYHDAEVGFIVEQADPAALIVAHRFRGFDHLEMAARLLDGRSDRPAVVVVRPEGALPDGVFAFGEVVAEDELPAVGRPEDVCLLLYTSGTTADPKGVLHSHQTLDHENRSIIDLFGITAADTIFMPSPVTHITGLLYGILLPAMLGSTAVLLDVWEPAVARDLVQAHRCRFTVGATPFLQGLAVAYEDTSATCELRAFACGGADVPPALVRRAEAVLGASVTRVYGSSEVPTVSGGGPADPPDLRAETDGRPLGLVTCRVDGPEDAGELLVRGPERFLGYLDPGLNDEAFTADGWFRTGDLATVEDGAVVIRGRLKDIIIRNGENISAKEVEDRLHLHPGVRDVAVVAVPDDRTGERACAVVVPATGAGVDLDDLRHHLDEGGLARQKSPERLVLVDELPRTASGKVQKFLLREQLASGALT